MRRCRLRLAVLGPLQRAQPALVQHGGLREPKQGPKTLPSRSRLDRAALIIRLGRKQQFSRALAANASTYSAIRRCGCGTLTIEVNTGASPGPKSLALIFRLHSVNHPPTLNHMVQFQGPHLDTSFAALSDATRRGILERLGREDASITDLAGNFHMTLTGMKKHVRVLEQAGLVTTEKVGRVRTCKLGRRRLEEEAAWIERYRQLWDERFDELDKIVEELKLDQKADGRRKRK